MSVLPPVGLERVREIAGFATLALRVATIPLILRHGLNFAIYAISGDRSTVGALRSGCRQRDLPLCDGAANL